MHYAACSTIVGREVGPVTQEPVWLHSFEFGRIPPVFRRRAGGLSGRPFCRIYLEKQLWVLELETASGGWMERAHDIDRVGHPLGPSRLRFPTLAAAIGYAERHGLDYRVIPPPAQRARPRHHRAAGGRGNKNGLTPREKASTKPATPQTE
jgi:hypothetical protein